MTPTLSLNSLRMQSPDLVRSVLEQRATAYLFLAISA